MSYLQELKETSKDWFVFSVIDIPWAIVYAYTPTLLVLVITLCAAFLTYFIVRFLWT